jgi:hypothetical protein
MFWVSVDELADRMLLDKFLSSYVLHIVHMMSPLVVIVLSIKYNIFSQKRFAQFVWVNISKSGKPDWFKVWEQIN